MPVLYVGLNKLADLQGNKFKVLLNSNEMRHIE